MLKQKSGFDPTGSGYDSLFDHLVGAREQGWRHGEAEGLGSGPGVEEPTPLSRDSIEPPMPNNHEMRAVAQDASSRNSPRARSTASGRNATSDKCEMLHTRLSPQLLW